MAFCVKPEASSPVSLSGDEEHFPIKVFFPPLVLSHLLFISECNPLLSFSLPTSHRPSPSSYQSLQPRGEIFTSTKTSSLSVFLSKSSFSLIIISPGRQIIANRTFSLYLSILFFFFTFFASCREPLFPLDPPIIPATDPIRISFVVFPHFLYIGLLLPRLIKEFMRKTWTNPVYENISPEIWLLKLWMSDRNQ